MALEVAIPLCCGCLPSSADEALILHYLPRSAMVSFDSDNEVRIPH
jgi:hypothetical protein